MNTKAKYLIKNTGILTISNFSSKILVFLLVPLYTSVLSTAEYGTYDLAISTVTLLYPILTVNIVDAVMRFAMDKKYNTSTIAGIGWKFLCRSFAYATVIALMLYTFNVYPEMTSLLPYTLLYYVAYVANQDFIQLAKGLEKIVVMGIAGVISTIVTVCANLLFLLVFRWGIGGFFLANILAQAVSVIFICFSIKFWDLLKEKDKIGIKELQKEMVTYSAPLIFTTLAWWANNAADKYVVTLLLGISANGLISVAYKIPQILNTLQGIFIQAWQISAIKEYDSDDAAKFYGQTFVVIMTLMEAAAAWILLLNRLFAKILYANDFYVAWKFVPFLLFSCLLNTAAGLLGPILAAKKDSKAMAKSAMWGLAVNIACNFLLIYFFGIQGGAIATAISSYVIYAVRKIACGNEIKIKGYWKVYATWILLIIQSIVEITALSRVFQIVIMGIMLLLNWATLKDVLLKFARRKIRS